MVFRNAVSKLRNTKEAKQEAEDNTPQVEFALNQSQNESSEAEQPTSSKQKRGKKRTSSEMEEEVAPADALSLMFSYFDKKFEGMQNNQKTEPPPTKKSEGHEIQGKGNKQQFSFNSELSFEVEKCTFYLNKGDLDSVHSGLNSISSKIKKRNKLIKLADRSSVGWSIVEEYEADPIASDSDDSRKIRQAEQRAIRKKKTKTSTIQQQSGFSTLTKPNNH